MKDHFPFDLSQAVAVCARAFFNDDLDRYFFPDARERLSRQRLLYTYFLTSNIPNIQITSPELEGLMVLEKHAAQPEKPTFPDLFSGRRLFKFGLGTLQKMIHFQIQALHIRKRLIQRPYWYLSLIAVAPEFQGQGFASRLLRPVLAQADAANTPVFLETHNPSNLPVYERLGFKIIATVRIKNTPLAHYCLRR